jgi:hypothetical protein
LTFNLLGLRGVQRFIGDGNSSFADSIPDFGDVAVLINKDITVSNIILAVKGLPTPILAPPLPPVAVPIIGSISAELWVAKANGAVIDLQTTDYSAPVLTTIQVSDSYLAPGFTTVNGFIYIIDNQPPPTPFTLNAGDLVAVRINNQLLGGVVPLPILSVLASVTIW